MPAASIRRSARVPAVLALLTLALAVTSSPARAQGGTSHLGNPLMTVTTAKILPPFTSPFDMSVAPGGWPSLDAVVTDDQQHADGNGRLVLAAVYNASSAVFNSATAWVDDSGTCGAVTKFEDPTTTASHVGTFTASSWAQSFRKDSLAARGILSFTGAKLYVMEIGAVSRAEFTLEVSAWQGTTRFFHTRQAAGLRITPDFTPLVEQVIEGGLGWTQTNPDGIHHDAQLDLTLPTIEVDLSPVAQGAQFTLTCDVVTEAASSGGELCRARAEFGDPLTSSGGIDLDVEGLTPTNDPSIPVLAVGDAPPAGPARLAARPNPSPGAVAFDLELAEAGEVTVEVFDLTGRRVASLGHERLAAGPHTLRWDGRDERGGPAAAGVYFARAQGPGLAASRRIVRLAGTR